jgi:beta-lactamase superfamily II metal-dependent hydrolase
MIRTPPDRDEIEVTLLGRGVGESVVAHLGDNEWMVVDTYMRGGEPAPEWYLRSLDVDPGCVKVLVLTHFHRDHYEGIDRLLDVYRKARMGVTRALVHDMFLPIYTFEDADNDLPGLAGVLRRARVERKLTPTTPGLLPLNAGQALYAGAMAEVKALSPSITAVDTACADVASALASEPMEKVRSRLRNDNRVSAALHINCRGFAILLGADLENEPAAFGWQAVVDDPLHLHLPQCDLVKVPHHGSARAHHSEAWQRFIVSQPWLAVAPYSTSGLPEPKDITRLLNRGRFVYQAAPSTKKTQDEWGNRISDPDQTGVVQARRHLGQHDWTVSLLPPAFSC